MTGLAEGLGDGIGVADRAAPSDRAGGGAGVRARCVSRGRGELLAGEGRKGSGDECGMSHAPPWQIIVRTLRELPVPMNCNATVAARSATAAVTVTAPSGVNRMASRLLFCLGYPPAAGFRGRTSRWTVAELRSGPM